VLQYIIGIDVDTSYSIFDVSKIDEWMFIENIKRLLRAILPQFAKNAINSILSIFTWKPIHYRVFKNLELRPMYAVFKELQKRKVIVKNLDTLEIFGYTGERHTKAYAPYISTLKVWEIDQKYENVLKKNFLMAEVKITDSYKEIRKTSRKFNLIVIDNPELRHGNHFEHFDLFPDVFRVAMDSTILIINVIPRTGWYKSKNFPPHWFDETHLARRKSFYQTNHPEDVSFEEILNAYKNFIITNGFNLEWHFFKKRSYPYQVYYLVLKINRRLGGQTNDAIDNVTPNDKYFRRDYEILKRREEINAITMKVRRDLNQKMALMEGTN